ncbi:hypothetical protein SLS58_000982 [Diplodia intermedia]|uniref:Uncharacterized protein n=1 Tax=Diplodia intermedia TaxID=856260 RepID=A0ABR3U3J7_9PEZI
MANPDGIDTSPGPDDGGRDHDRDVQIMRAILGNLLLSPKVYLAGIAARLNTDIDSARDEVNGILRRLTRGDERIQIGRADSSPSHSEENGPHASAPVDTVKEEHHVVDSLLMALDEKRDDAVDALPAAATSHAHVSSPSVMPPPPADGNSGLVLVGTLDHSTAALAPAPAPPALVYPPDLLRLMNPSQHPEGEENKDDDYHHHGKDGEKRTHASDNGEDEQPPAKRAKTEAAAEETGEEKVPAADDQAMVTKEEKETATLNDTEQTVKTALTDWLNAANEAADKSCDEPTEEPSDEPADKSSDEPADKPAEELAHKSSNEPADKPAEEPADKPAEEPSSGV